MSLNNPLLKAVKYIRTWCLYQLNRPVKNRKDLPLLLNILNLNGEGVEIGVCEGEYSKVILGNSKLSVLYSIDPWMPTDPKKWLIGKNNVPLNEQEKRYGDVINKLEKYGERSRIMRMLSEEASSHFEPESLDFVYIDGNHSYEMIKLDLELWWPKVKIGGIFGGHDYLNGIVRETDFGVKKAVDEFVKTTNQDLFVNPQKWPTWYVRKKL